MAGAVNIPPETLFEEAPCFITVQDRDLNILQANRRFRETFGVEATPLEEAADATVAAWRGREQAAA